jgi:hypothetical protein
VFPVKIVPRLPNVKVLAAGGGTLNGWLASAELFDPNANPQITRVERLGIATSRSISVMLVVLSSAIPRIY